jgi:hypothetical protein
LSLPAKFRFPATETLVSSGCNADGRCKADVPTARFASPAQPAMTLPRWYENADDGLSDSAASNASEALFAIVNKFEPHRHLATVLKLLVLALGAAAIARRLLHQPRALQWVWAQQFPRKNCAGPPSAKAAADEARAKLKRAERSVELTNNSLSYATLVADPGVVTAT